MVGVWHGRPKQSKHCWSSGEVPFPKADKTGNIQGCRAQISGGAADFCAGTTRTVKSESKQSAVSRASRSDSQAGRKGALQGASGRICLEGALFRCLKFNQQDLPILEAPALGDTPKKPRPYKGMRGLERWCSRYRILMTTRARLLAWEPRRCLRCTLRFSGRRIGRSFAVFAFVAITPRMPKLENNRSLNQKRSQRK